MTDHLSVSVWLRTSPRSKWKLWGRFADEAAARNALNRRWVPGEKLLIVGNRDPNEDDKQRA